LNDKWHNNAAPETAAERDSLKAANAKLRNSLQEMADLVESAITIIDGLKHPSIPDSPYIKKARAAIAKAVAEVPGGDAA
jgi:hypothetical protein